MTTKFITNEQLYEQAIKPIAKAKSYVWIGTADIKDLHVLYGGRAVSFLYVLDQLARNRIQIRLLYAKEPGPNFQSSFAKYALLDKYVERMLCPRVHFKHIVIDGEFAYTGSGNLTGAGLGMKSPDRRNFESGIVTTDSNLVDQISSQFDDVWMGKFCKSCGRKAYCSNPIK